MSRICANAGPNVSHLCICRTYSVASVQMSDWTCHICTDADPMCCICAKLGPNVSHLCKSLTEWSASVHQRKRPNLRDKQQFAENFFVQKWRSQKTYLEVSTTPLKWFKGKKRFLEQILVQKWSSQKAYWEVSRTPLKWFKSKKRFLEQFLVQ